MEQHYRIPFRSICAAQAARENSQLIICNNKTNNNCEKNKIEILLAENRREQIDGVLVQNRYIEKHSRKTIGQSNHGYNKKNNEEKSK